MQNVGNQPSWKWAWLIVILEVQIDLRFSIHYAGWVTSKIPLIVLQCVQPVNLPQAAFEGFFLLGSRCQNVLSSFDSAPDLSSAWHISRVRLTPSSFLLLYFAQAVTSTWVTLYFDTSPCTYSMQWKQQDISFMDRWILLTSTLTES